MPLLPDICLSIVDVRDVAAAHIAGMTSPKAPGINIIMILVFKYSNFSHSLMGRYRKCNEI